MDDPELRNDEKVLIRTPGVYVKSVPFEGILTNKRIILIDRAKNLLPSKEIPLGTIKEIESGENAIRDQIITLSVMTKAGETRQMILTFSRQEGGNRIRERDVWARLLKENTYSSLDHVIRKVIPGQEPATRRAEPLPHQRYEVVHSPHHTTPSGERHPAGTAMDEMSTARRSIAASPDPTGPQPSAVRQTEVSSLGMNLFCSKCGNRVPAESVFCNRCGSSISRIQPVAAPVQTPAALPIVKIPAIRPIDEEIQSIEPLIEPSLEKIPADALRVAPAKAPSKLSIVWDGEEESEQGTIPAGEIPETKPVDKDLSPQPHTVQSSDTVTTAPGPSSAGTSETPPPPKPPSDRNFMSGKQPILTAAVVVVAILFLAAAALFIYPILAATGSTTPNGEGDVTAAATSSTVSPSGPLVLKETQAPVIPPAGVYVHVNYLGGFKGSYGIPDMITTVPGNSGDRVWEVENATNSTVQATFEKLDGSSHELLVEIYKDSKALTSGTTTVGHGSVALSVDIVTGIAAAPVTSGGGGTAKTDTVTAVTTAAAVKTTASTANTTTVATSTTTTAMATTTTTAAS